MIHLFPIIQSPCRSSTTPIATITAIYATISDLSQPALVFAFDGDEKVLYRVWLVVFCGRIEMQVSFVLQRRRRDEDILYTLFSHILGYAVHNVRQNIDIEYCQWLLVWIII